MQHLGHSIANDPNYGGDIWYGNPEGKRSCQIAEERLSVINQSEDTSYSSDIPDECERKKLKTDIKSSKCEAATSAIDVPATETEVQNRISTATRGQDESIHAFIERTCVWCARCRSVPSTDRAVLEFLIRSPGIWLHALQYRFPVHPLSSDGDECGGKDTFKSFRATLPDWHDLSKVQS